ncbi:unnamed protein product [Danaus chrysippus]|uniref:(African queen) hypothetical protein n=1 Tax=Danaus chrysippus TaxID=151541 RepID=A0A8J2R8X3_9NEOP|nr:unnamed protein product [Danaus chrysippus]
MCDWRHAQLIRGVTAEQACAARGVTFKMAVHEETLSQCNAMKRVLETNNECFHAGVQPETCENTLDYDKIKAAATLLCYETCVESVCKLQRKQDLTGPVTIYSKPFSERAVYLEPKTKKVKVKHEQCCLA